MRILKILLVVPALQGLGCEHKDDGEPAAALRRPAAAVSAPAPVDHLAEGELVEGKDKAFALILPRDVKIERAFANEVLAHSEAAPEAIANYVRARVREGTVTAGAMGTTFERVKVPSEPTRELLIRISSGRGYRSAVEIRDITRPVIEDPGNDGDRWKQAGFLPNGQPIDPKHMQ